MAKTAHKALSSAQKMSQAKKVGVNTKVSAQDQHLTENELNQATIAGLTAAKKNNLVADKTISQKQVKTTTQDTKTSQTDAQADADVAVLADVDQNYDSLKSDLAKFDATWSQTQSHSGWGNIVADASQANMNPWLVAGGVALGGIAAIAIAANSNDSEDDEAVTQPWEEQFFSYADGLNIDPAVITLAVGNATNNTDNAYFYLDEGLTRAEALDYKNNMQTEQSGSFSFYAGGFLVDSGDFAFDARGLILNMGEDVDYLYASISASAQSTVDGGAESEVILLNTFGIQNTNVSLANVTATASVYAYAYNNTNTSRTDNIDGDAEVVINHLYLDIEATNSAYANLASVYASVDAYASTSTSQSNDGTATIYIGDINLNALATGPDASAYASVEEISAYAHDGGVATINIGDITIEATADNYAFVYMDSAYASASGNGVATITIGDINLSATVTDDAITASVFATWSGASVDASDNGVASVTIGNVSVRALAEEGSADAAAYAPLDASADDDAQASVTVGNVEVLATAYTGSATVTWTNYDIGADARDNGVATVSVGNILLEAVGADYANASFNAYFTAEASDYGIANLSIGNVTINASVSADGSGGADASFNGSITASADDAGVATITVGNISLLATTPDGGDATVYMYQISADADEAGVATITVGNIDLSAYAGDGYASAYLSYITADATDNAIATINIGDISLTASGTSAYVYFSSISASADDAGQAYINIGDISLNAIGNSNGAYAELYYLLADVSEIGIAEVNVGNISVIAEGSYDGQVTASVNSISADAYDNGRASLNLGNLFVQAINNASTVANNAAYASVSYISAQATDNGYASISMGSVTVSASAEDTANAYLYFTGNDATDNAEISVTAGDILVKATADDSYALLSVSVTADDDAIAHVSLGNITLSADSVSAYFNNYNVATLDVGQIDITLQNGDNDQLNLQIEDVTYDVNRSVTIRGDAGNAIDANLTLDRGEDNNLSIGRLDLTELPDAVVNLQIGDTITEYGANFNNLTFSGLKFTTIYGWDAVDGASTIQFGDESAVGNFEDIAGRVATLDALWTSLNTELDGTDSYVFTQINEGTAGDVNGDSYIDAYLGVLAFNEGANGVDGLLFFSNGGEDLRLDDSLLFA